MYNEAQRITLEDSFESILNKIGEGNSGAIGVLCKSFTLSSAIDPDSALKGFSLAVGCDSNGIYGENVWILFKDICQESLVGMLAVMRACQMGFIREPMHVKP